jgi:hypothetical protein
MRARARGHWEGDDSFVVEWDEIGNRFLFQYTLSFGEDGLELTVSEKTRQFQSFTLGGTTAPGMAAGT